MRNNPDLPHRQDIAAVEPHSDEIIERRTQNVIKVLKALGVDVDEYSINGFVGTTTKTFEEPDLAEVYEDLTRLDATKIARILRRHKERISKKAKKVS